MNYKVEIFLSGIMIVYLLIELVRINLLKKDNNDLLAGLISVILLLYGMYLSLRYGLKLDYGSLTEIQQSQAQIMSFTAIASLVVSLFFIIISVVKFMITMITKKKG